ncbi:hypothetical protein GCM10025865_20540 [Paraoerskovia sediminicola]|uniref:Uncharacterized protein n=1 Tax=Paraoerskovia sediminicola TaxID=1138587 RepID=A0ABM8G3T3_9CELL|nr:hypothetical protein [Paraoerskovia sediminicola]BDZ42755.1 hypothetical protein GCM10025865_20540 [Paraoerskovia sediminicola]
MAIATRTTTNITIERIVNRSGSIAPSRPTRRPDRGLAAAALGVPRGGVAVRGVFDVGFVFGVEPDVLFAGRGGAAGGGTARVAPVRGAADRCPLDRPDAARPVDVEDLPVGRAELPGAVGRRLAGMARSSHLRRRSPQDTRGLWTEPR